MFYESTLSKRPDQRTTFEWEFDAVGAKIDHGNGAGSYIIPWNMIFEIHAYAKSIAIGSVVTVGIGQQEPTPGSVGDWLLGQSYTIETGALTPRHLSFIGPILIRLGAVSGHQHSGVSVQWIIA